VRDLFGLSTPEEEPLAKVHTLPTADARAQRR
jgi:hypothetical protein